MQSRRRGSNRGARLIRRLVGADFAEARGAAERAAHSAREPLGGYPHSHSLGLANLELGFASAGAGDIVAGQEALHAAIADLRASDGESSPGVSRAAEVLARLGG